MNIIGREREKDILLKCLGSKRPEFLVLLVKTPVGVVPALELRHFVGFCLPGSQQPERQVF